MNAVEGWLERRFRLAARGKLAPEAVMTSTALVAALMTGPMGAIPPFLARVVRPFTYSITHGIGAAVVTHAALRALAGRAREVHPLSWACAAAFVLHFVYG